MVLSRVRWLLLVAACAPAICFAGKPKKCFTANQASRMLNKDVCVTAHIYDVVRLPDGTRFLDVCPPTTPDADCRFTIVSFRRDRDEVGRLAKYKDRNVHIRGMVLPVRGGAWMVLDRVRQFYGGPPKFRPNPLLLHGFNADSDRAPIYDPNLRTRGSGRSATNTRNQETRPRK
jgi:hypothetical protein